MLEEHYRWWEALAIDGTRPTAIGWDRINMMLSRQQKEIIKMEQGEN